MTSITSVRNQTQSAGNSFRKAKRVSNSNTGVYTVPINKRARITDILGILDAVGSDATYSIAIKRFVTGLFEPITNFGVVSEKLTCSLVTLESGDILTDIGDSGATNASMDITATIEEFSK